MDAESLAGCMGSALAESPLLARVVMASVELALLGGLVWALECLLLRRRPRVAALLWVVVMVNAVVSVAFDAPVSFAVFRLPDRTPVMPQDGGVSNGASILTNRPDEEAVSAGPMGEMGDPGRAFSGQEGRWRQHVLGAARAVLAHPGVAPLSVWLAGAGLFAAFIFRDRLRLWRLLREARIPDDAIRQQFDAIAAELGIRQVPRMAITRVLDSPAIVGAFWPVVLVPAWMLEPGEARRLTWALRHELTHAKMADPLVNAVAQLMRVLYFFHPVAWWVARRWRAAMELACDHALLHSEADVREYLETLHVLLLSIHSRRKPRLSCGLFAVRSQLGRRVAALVCIPLRPRPMGPAAIAGVLALAIAAFAVGGYIAPAAQAQTKRLWPVRGVLQFPEDRSMGTLYVQPMGIIDDSAWEPWAEAQGAVTVPDGVLVRLEFPPGCEAMKDLSPLDALGQDDIQSILLRTRPRNWSEFRHLDHLNLWQIECRPTLGYGGSGNGKQGPEPPPSDVLVFPEDRSMGYVYASAGPMIPKDGTWEPWQEARGSVAVPRATHVIRLELSDEAMDDLSPLAAFGKYDLHSIAFHRKPRSWEDLAPIQDLSLWEIEYKATLAYGAAAQKEK